MRTKDRELVMAIIEAKNRSDSASEYKALNALGERAVESINWEHGLKLIALLVVGLTGVVSWFSFFYIIGGMVK